MGLLRFAKFSDQRSFIEKVRRRTAFIDEQRRIDDLDERKPLNKIDWILDKGTFVRNETFAENATVTVFTVPAGQTLHVNTLTLGYRAESANGGSLNVQINDQIVFRMTPANVTNIDKWVAIPFPIPIPIQEGGTIKVRSFLVDLFAFCSFTGFTVLNSEVQEVSSRKRFQKF